MTMPMVQLMVDLELNGDDGIDSLDLAFSIDLPVIPRTGDRMYVTGGYELCVSYVFFDLEAKPVQVEVRCRRMNFECRQLFDCASDALVAFGFTLARR